MTGVEVHDIEISLDGKDEMLRLMAGDQEFARIIVKPMEDGTCVLKVYDVNEDKSEKFLKWVSGISSLTTQESLA
ncbi:MAG: hypothetical protein VXW30_06220 [Candidatus Thermoplasmatota archaeon]|nr:hypothetical protein [Candidatus Thermoplasmatota archaeon]MEC7143157.1 hypothetical protein [Candidatus Thermoplasmatota archaeon]MEC7391400.1 hypothetical protein [Candidatus Thermoplasmatota archaeon]MEC7435503.1 hypothetical protein [Candidatus Thermoplasmatota archaeon]MEC7462410.1 hypothetical protein [Candidatus Thermoplasmatota archaeon]